MYFLVIGDGHGADYSTLSSFLIQALVATTHAMSNNDDFPEVNGLDDILVIFYSSTIKLCLLL